MTVRKKKFEVSVIASHKTSTLCPSSLLSFPENPLVFFEKMTDLSNDSYSTVNIGLDEGASPHSARNSFLHGSSATPPYLSSHSNPMGQGNHFPYSDNIVYTPLGELYILKQTCVERPMKSLAWLMDVTIET